MRKGKILLVGPKGRRDFKLAENCILSHIHLLLQLATQHMLYSAGSPFPESAAALTQPFHSQQTKHAENIREPNQLK